MSGRPNTHQLAAWVVCTRVGDVRRMVTRALMLMKPARAQQD
jgi:hypothetical protein